MELTPPNNRESGTSAPATGQSTLEGAAGGPLQEPRSEVHTELGPGASEQITPDFVRRNFATLCMMMNNYTREGPTPQRLLFDEDTPVQHGRSTRTEGSPVGFVTPGPSAGAQARPAGGSPNAPGTRVFVSQDGEEDLSVPYKPAVATKFSRRIATFRFPPKIRMPPNVKVYDGTTDPDDHMGVFSGAAEVEQWSMPVWCHMFSQTLAGSARVWFDSLTEGSIDSFEELRQKFLTQFMVQQRYTRDPVEIHNIRQKEHESLTAFMERYNLESLQVQGANETLRISGFIHGIRSKGLIERLNAHVPKTVKEMMEMVKAYIRGKEASAQVDEAVGRRNSGKQAWRSNPRKSYTPSRGKQGDYPPKTPYSPVGARQNDNFTALIKTPSEILATEDARVGFLRPRPMIGDPNKRGEGYCEFHADKGHHTNDCWQLKRQIEDAVRSGQLAHLVKEIKNENKGAPGGRRNGPQNKDKDVKVKVNKEVQMFGRYQERDTRERSMDQEWMDQPIVFPPPGRVQLTKAPLIIKGVIGDQIIHRIYVDGGASVELMYEHCFKELPSETRRRLIPADSPLVGFAGEVVWPMGQILLPVTLGEPPLCRTEVMNFAVVKAPSSRYNMIIGRPGMMALGAVASNPHAELRFPTPRGIAVVEAEASKVNECQRIEEEDMRHNKERRVPKDEKVVIHPHYPDQRVTIGGKLSRRTSERLVEFLRRNRDVFAWEPSDMTGIPRSVIEHHLYVHSSIEPKVQKKRSLAPDRARAALQEVKQLVEAGILREVRYQTWVANPVMVKKEDKSWRMCVDFKDINKACPKDCYPLPNIDSKVEALVGFKWKCFLDAYKGYHQIQMAGEDEDKTAFHTEAGPYCYTKMPFGLKNAGATYQRMIDKVFGPQIGRNMEAYVDDLVLKSRHEEELMDDIAETFQRLRSVNMKLNPKKCSFGVTEGRFLGHVITEAGMLANPEKIEAIQKMASPKSLKDVQRLNGRLAALSRYLARSAERSLPFFQTLKRCITKNDFRWTTEAEESFLQIKEYLKELPMLTAPELGETLVLYLAASDCAISAVLLTERKKQQVPIFFVSRALHAAELNYQPLEKLALALVHAARRLKKYFQSNPVVVVTDQPIRQVLERPEISGRLAKWAIELGEFGITYRARGTMRGQVLADFISEMPMQGELEGLQQSLMPEIKKRKSKIPRWKLYTDGSSSSEGAGAGMVLVGPDGMELTYALRFDFPATNKESEYEALLAGIRMAKKLNICGIKMYVDSKLVANQVNGTYEAKDEKMEKYLKKVQEELKAFKYYKIKQVPRSKNKKADVLSKIASVTFNHLKKEVLVEVLERSSLEEQEMGAVVAETDPNWMTPIRTYLVSGELPSEGDEARKIRIKAPMYTIVDGVLFRKNFLGPLLRCVGPAEASYVVREVHEGSCGMHAGPRAIARKLMKLGYFWPSMHQTCFEEIKTCQACQVHAPIPKGPKNDMIPVTSPWPFHKWGMDIVGPFPTAPGGFKFLLVAIDYFTKWVEAKALTTINGKQVKKFVWDNIVCRFGLPGELVTDNGKQFIENPFKSWCEELQIKQVTVSVAYPQGNGQVERANRSIVDAIKRRLTREGSNWMDHLTHVLWAHRTMPKTSNGETPFSLTYGTEAVIPVEVGMPTHRTTLPLPETNEEDLRVNLNLLEERRELAAINEAKYKQKIEKYYNQRVKRSTFKEGDLVYRKNEASKAQDQGKLGPNWEGPYVVKEALRSGSYYLRTISGEALPRPWHGIHLRRCYM